MSHESANHLRNRLLTFGLSRMAIDAAWPTWWSDDADSSAAARADLRFSLARKLGLAPQSLLDCNEPRFVWHDAVRFKHLAGESESAKASISSFGAALSNILIGATPNSDCSQRVPASEGRTRTPTHHAYPRFVDLLDNCWSFRIPVICLRIFPLYPNRISAMAVRLRSRAAILIGTDLHSPPRIAFQIAHALAHITLGHIQDCKMIVDLESDEHSETIDDDEEREADRWALQMVVRHLDQETPHLTGNPSPRKLARRLTESVCGTQTGSSILASCFGHSTSQLETTHGVTTRAHTLRPPAWEVVNRIALANLSLEHVRDDSLSYLFRVLGTGADSRPLLSESTQFYVSRLHSSRE